MTALPAILALANVTEASTKGILHKLKLGNDDGVSRCHIGWGMNRYRHKDLFPKLGTCSFQIWAQ